jgi:hypothetical protein
LFYRALTPSFSSRAPRIAATAMLTLGGMTYARFVSHLYGMHLNNSFLFALLLYWFARVDRLPRRIFLVGLGLGVGYWVSDFVWVLLACVLAAQLQVWRVLRNLTLRSLLLCVLGFTVGALPRIIHSYSPEDWYAPYRAGGFALVRVSAIPRRVLDLAFATLPAYFFGELRSMRTIGSFLLIVGAGLTVLILTFAAVPISREWRQGKSSAFVPACVFLLAALACVLVVLNRKVFDSGYRYLWPMQFAVAVAFAKAMDCMEKWRSFRGPLRTLCRVCLALPCLLGALALFRAQQADAHLSLSTKMRSLAAQALSNGCRVGVADYWYAYGPSYFTREQLRLDPIYTSRILSYSRSASLAIAAGTRYCAILDLSDHAQVTELNRRLYERLQAQASRIYHYPGSIVLLVLGADPVEGV